MRFLRHSIVFLLVCLLVAFVAGRPRHGSERVALADAPPRHAFRVLFGVGDTAEQKWDGRVALSGGKLVRLDGWRFWQSDRVEGGRFQLATRVGQMEDQLHPNPVFPGRVDRLIPAAVLVTVEGDGAQVSVESAAGNFSFRENEVAYGQPASFLDGRVRVERIPASERLSGPEMQDDYPAITATRKGETWVSWIGYRDAADRVFVRRQAGGEWSPAESWQEPVAAAAADYFRTAIAEDGAGRVWVVWAAQVEGAWDLYARAFDGGRWLATERLTSGAGPNLFHKLARASDGRLYLAWQGFRNGISSILLKRHDGKRWSPEMLLSQGAGSSWEPSLAADSKGRVWVAWDGYGAGNYDIYVRRVVAGNPGPLQQVTRSPNFQAHADIACDAQDRPWIAWDEAGPNWGKDWSHDVPRGTLLYLNRKVRLAFLEQGAWREPQSDAMDAVPAEIRGWNELPQIGWEGGRLWLVFRNRTDTSITRPDNFAANGRWHFYATCLLGDRWMPAVFLPDSVGRNYMRAALAPAPGARGGMLVAWPTDSRAFRGPGGAFGTPPPRQLDVFLSRLELPAPWKVGPLILSRPLDQIQAAGAAPVHPAENAEVARIRQYRIPSGGKSYRILRGDMHRHTELSGDGSGDGSLFDLYRYAIDAARLDYALVGDHQMGNGDEYNWWITQKSNDLFFVNGGFQPMYGYERSVPYPNGHRNLVFPRRGVRALPISPEEQKAVVNSGSVLYPHLKQHGAIAMEHSLATSQGTDWRDNDPEVEPLVEIYQGYHSSYEYEGAPKTESDATGHVHGQYEPAGFFWNALARGYRLGVQASSDHISTHVSYACILSEDTSRRGLIEAMRKRHAYAATDNIILDYRIVDGAGREYLQGDAFATAGAPRIVVKIIGTAPIRRVDVVKNRQFVFTRSPGTPTFDFTYQDLALAPGESYFYVRVTQQDGQMAWSSPIWVKYGN